MGSSLSNCLKTTEPLQGDSLLFTTQPLRLPGTYLIDLIKKAELTLEPPSSFEPETPRLGIQHINCLQKKCLLKCIKVLVCENPLAVNELMSLKKCWNLKKVLLCYFLIILSQLDLEKIIFSQS